VPNGRADKSPRKSVFDDIEYLGNITPAPFSPSVHKLPYERERKCNQKQLALE
jgi:hypothetical protein